MFQFFCKPQPFGPLITTNLTMIQQQHAVGPSLFNDNQLLWTGPVPGAVNFQVFRQINGGGFSLIQTQTAASTSYFPSISYVDSGLASTWVYGQRDYYVVSLNASSAVITTSNVATLIWSLAATPTFSPVAGTYNTPQTVAISSTTPSNTIYYTTDGSTPTTASNLYTGPVSVSVSETLQAIATAFTFGNSAVGSAVYTIQITATYVNEGYGVPISWFAPNGAQAIALPAGVDPGDLLLLLTGTFLGTINPPAVAGWTWLTPSYTNRSLALYGRIATGTGDAPSVNWGTTPAVFAAGMTACYSGNPTTLTGIVDQFASRQINSTNSTAYSAMTVTNDNSLVIGGGILNLDNTTNEAGGVWANIGSGTGFVVQAQSPVNNNRPALVFNEWIQSAATGFASLSQAFSITQSALQTAEGFTISLIAGNGQPPQAATPTFSPAAGTYSSTQSVTISCSTPSSTIYYTTDGTTPTFPVTGTTLQYTAPISVSVTETINAIGTAAANQNSAIATAAYTISASLTTYKFNPGEYAMTLQYQHNVTLAFATTDINALSTHHPPSGPVGYVMGANWAAVETGAQVDNPTFNQGILNTQYPGFAVWEQIFNQLQATIPGAHMGISIMANQYGKSFSGSTITTANWGNGQFIPAYIANCNGNLTVPNGYGSASHTTYPVAPIYSGSSFYGLAFDTLSAGVLTTAIPAFWNPGVNQAFINFIQAASHYIIQSGPNAGQTFDQCPLIELFLFNDEWSYNLGSSQNVTGVTVNPPNFTNSINQPTVANAIAANKLMLRSACAAFPHTLVLNNMSFTFGASNTAAQTAGFVNDKLSGSGTSLSTIRGLALCSADTFCTDWTSAGGADYAKQGYVGVASPAFGSTIVATGNTLKGFMPKVAQIQPSDYHVHMSPGATPYTASAVQALTQSADNTYIQSTHRLWCMGDDVGTGGNQGAWIGYVQPTLVAGTGVAPFSTVLPTSLATGGIVFNFFIAPNGDDNNVGSLASPWSITALNSKQATYRGLNVGIIGDVSGVQTPITQGTIGGVHTTLLSIANGNGNQPVLNIDGGTVARSTVIASCNSSGIYTPRWAIIDFGSPTNQVMTGLGQSSNSAIQVPHPGYMTIDGLTVRNFTYSAISMDNQGGSQLPGFVLKNCEIYNGTCSDTSNNPGAVRYTLTTGALMTNNKIHDLSIAGGAWGFAAFRTYGLTSAGTQGAIITNNTTYNCTSILTKDGFSDFANCSYNYFDFGNFGSANNNAGLIGQGVVTGHSPAAGVTTNFHHNICLGAMQFKTQAGGNTIAGIGNVYQNTFYGTSNATNFDAMFCMNATGAASIQFQHNIVYAIASYDHAANGSCMYVDSGYAIANATFNNNVYGSNLAGVVWSRAGEDQTLSFATWKSTYSVDSTSVQVATTPFSGTPTALTPSTFAVNASAVIGGVTCGALDGSGSVGCNF